MSEEHPEQQQDQSQAEEGSARLVPVAESIKYRRRAQQAEATLQQLQQQLDEAKSRLDGRSDELAAAEAQRDEALSHLQETENRLAAERLLSASGVVDVETAMLLLGKRLDLSEELGAEALQRSVEQLLLDKPFIRRPLAEGSLPPGTASHRPARGGVAARLAQAAQRAAHSGDRRDVAEYLRLRHASSAGGK